ncbi:hypothetical protein HV341_10590 [Citrobacter sp. RHBSTW-00976]|uniref:hypothetical protein n=1 Tax=Citrobacter sp. RHBSTW-00976 TaxID=2742674 RepID=UPI0015EADD6A|nr:hypothetical protein [Citrobacter sp. RHBSTW-00976]QLR62484.1 hypothetical protein HV341_10590 [Citrobacter sp. RHBSTW-00976]
MDKTKLPEMMMTCREQAGHLRRLAVLAKQTECGEIGLSSTALVHAAVVIESLCNAGENALAGIARLDRSETQLIGERDQVINALDGMYKAVLGHPPEWSSAYGFNDAIDDVATRIQQLEGVGYAKATETTD